MFHWSYDIIMHLWQAMQYKAIGLDPKVDSWIWTVCKYDEHLYKLYHLVSCNHHLHCWTKNTEELALATFPVLFSYGKYQQNVRYIWRPHIYTLQFRCIPTAVFHRQICIYNKCMIRRGKMLLFQGIYITLYFLFFQSAFSRPKQKLKHNEKPKTFKKIYLYMLICSRFENATPRN